MRDSNQILIPVTLIVLALAGCVPSNSSSEKGPTRRLPATNQGTSGTANPTPGTTGTTTPQGTTGSQVPGTTVPIPTPYGTTTATTGGGINTVPAGTDCYKGTPFVCKIEKLINTKTNIYRSTRGKGLLLHDAKVSFVARDWSSNQARSNRISHSGFPSTRQTIYRQEFGVSVGFYAENVAMSGAVNAFDESDASAAAIAEEFTSMWWRSSGHRENMLGDYSSMGVGVAQTSNGSWYATQIFQ